MRPADSTLLTALHEGMFEQPLWTGFLDQLRARTRADLITLVFMPVGEERMVELHSGTLPEPHISQLFETRFYDSLPYRQMRAGRVYTLEELVDPTDPANRAFHEELVGPSGLSHNRTIRITEPGGLDAWLACSGGKGVGWAAVGSLMSELAPHLRIALRIFAAMERDRFRSAVTSEAFRRLDFGWLTLDAQCRIIDMTPHMDQFFQRSNVLRRGRYDRLVPASPAIDRELVALLRDFAADPEARPRAINLCRDPLIDMLVRPMPERSLTGPSAEVAVAYVSGDRWSQADRCDQLVDLFGLLPSEARLAWAISQGLSIVEAGESLGLTVETARNYSKRIYAKTGARGQVELVRIILTSVLALA